MRIPVSLIVTSISFCLIGRAVAQQPPAPETPKDHVAAITLSLQKSMAAMHQYQWVETTVVSIKGEEKSRKQSNCYYGVEGTLEKTPIAEPGEDAKTPRGLRGKIVENKKEEISDDVKKAVALVKEYVPPSPAKIQAAKEAGKLFLTPPDAQGRVQIVIKDYLKPGDSLTMEVIAVMDRLARVKVATYGDSPADVIGLNVEILAFPDGTVYPATINLDVKSQDLAVAITNNGYKKLGG